MRRTLTVLVLVAGLAGACRSDPSYRSYLVNQQPDSVLVVFDGRQADGLGWT